MRPGCDHSGLASFVSSKMQTIAEVRFSRDWIFDETDGHEEKLRLRVSFAKLSLARTRMRLT